MRKPLGSRSPYTVTVGQRFGKLVVTGVTPSVVYGHVAFPCRCDCGRETTVTGSHLFSGHTRSCGCLHRAHGHCDNAGGARRPSLTYVTWTAMWQRCTNPRHPAFQQYGGRGIVVCERWGDFTAFLADMGERPSAAHSLDRIDNDAGYEPGNTRWATSREQALNRRDTRRITAFGRTLTLVAWTVETGIGASTVRERLRRGWSPEAALSAPVAMTGARAAKRSREALQ